MKTLAAVAAILLAGSASAAPGLSGTFYHTGANSTGYNIAQTLSVLSTATPTGTFVSSAVNYGGGDGSDIVSFLGADGASYVGPSGPYDLSDGILDMKGYLYIPTAGTYNFALVNDDAAQLSIGGTPIISVNCCGYSTGSATFATAGYKPIDVVYANTYFYGVGQAYVTLYDGSGSVLSSGLTTTVPEPAAWALMLAGFGALGLALRAGRKTATAWA